jgi:hypothetical protein
MKNERGGGRGAHIKTIRDGINITSRDGDIFGISSTAGLTQQLPVTAAVVLPGDTKFALTAANVRVYHHPVALYPLCYPWSNGSYLSSSICSRDMRVFKFYSRPALTDPQIQTVKRSGFEAYEDFS